MYRKFRLYVLSSVNEDKLQPFEKTVIDLALGMIDGQIFITHENMREILDNEQNFNEEVKEAVAGLCVSFMTDDGNEFKWFQEFIEISLLRKIKIFCDDTGITSPYALAVRALRYKDYYDILNTSPLEDIERRFKRDLKNKTKETENLLNAVRYQLDDIYGQMEEKDE